MARRSVGTFRRTDMSGLRDYGFEPKTHRQQVFSSEIRSSNLLVIATYYISFQFFNKDLANTSRLIMRTNYSSNCRLFRSPLLDTLLVSKIAISY